LPLAETWPLCAPLRFPLVFVFGLQRAPEAGRELLAVREPAGRAPEGRASEVERRAGRLPGFDCAGLRSRECVARRGGLKWGRAAGFPAAAGLRTGVRGVCASA